MPSGPPEVVVERNRLGLNRYTMDDKSGLWLVGIMDQLAADVKLGRLEPEKARELFRRELRLFVPESAVR